MDLRTSIKRNICARIEAEAICPLPTPKGKQFQVCMENDFTISYKLQRFLKDFHQFVFQDFCGSVVNTRL